jgi:hypothetical protein
MEWAFGGLGVRAPAVPERIAVGVFAVRREGRGGDG